MWPYHEDEVTKQFTPRHVAFRFVLDQGLVFVQQFFLHMCG